MALVVFLAALAFLGASQPTHAVHPTFHRSDGSVIHIEGLTWRTNQILQARPLWVEKGLGFLPPQLSAWFGPSHLGWEMTGSPYPNLWFSWRDASNRPISCGESMALFTFDSAGRKIEDVGRSCASGQEAVQSGSLQMIDWRCPQLRFRLEIGRDIFSFSLPNPRLGEKFPIWAPRPIPQSQSTNGFIFILEGVERSADGWRPKVRVEHDGQAVDGWFRISHQFIDPTGSRSSDWLPSSETVWRADLTACPGAQFPFPPEKTIELGRIEQPANEGPQLLPLQSSAREAGIVFAIVANAGAYHFKNGLCDKSELFPRGQSFGRTVIRREESGDWSATLMDDRNPPGRRLYVAFDDKSAESWDRRVTDDDGPSRLVVRVLTADGEASDESLGSWTRAVGVGQLPVFHYYLPKRAANGAVDLSLALANALQVSFTIAAPSRIETKPESKSL
jgi:hypothetical protein